MTIDNTATVNSGECQLIDSYHRQYAELYRSISIKIGSKAEAEDLMQDLYLKLRDLEPALRANVKEPERYLRRIAANLVVDHFRSCRRHNALMSSSDEQDEPLSPGERPEMIVQCEQTAQILKDELSRMPAVRRQVFMLFRYRNLSRQEIACDLGLSLEAVHKHILRAMQQCRQALERSKM